MSRTSATTQITNPVQISSSAPQQFRIVNGGDSFSINVSESITGISGTNPIYITPPTQFSSPVQFAGIRTRQLTLASRATIPYDASIAFVAITTANIGGIAHIADSAGLADGFEIRLPAGAHVAAQILATSGISVAMNDTIDTIIVNDTPKTAKIALIDAINDTMAPLDGSGEIVCAARSQLLVSCVFLSPIAPLARANYLIGRYGASAGGGGGGMVVAANVAAFPPVGDVATMYVAADTNKIYRYQSGSIPNGYNWSVGPSGDFPNLQDALASASVLDGHKIYVQNGVYPITTTMTIAKQVQIFGQNRADVILESLGTATDPVGLISITVGNVVMRGLTIRHQKTTNTTIECAIVISGPGSTRVSSFIADDCLIEYVEFAMQIRGNNWKIANSVFSYIGPNNSTRAVAVYGVGGNCFITGNTFMSNNAGGTRRAITPTVVVPADTFIGTLAIEDNVQRGPLSHFLIQDGFLGNPAGYNILFKRNTVAESSVFASLFAAVANDGDIIGGISAENNSLANTSGKGIITAEGAVATFRSSSMPIHISGNTLASMSIAGPAYVLAIGASDASCAYASMIPTPVTVSQDAVIPATPSAPVTPTIWSVISGYWEMSAAPVVHKESITILSPEDLTAVDLKHTALANSLILFKNRQSLNQGVDYLLSIVSGVPIGSQPVSRLTWANAIAPGGAEQLVVGDRISATYFSN